MTEVVELLRGAFFWWAELFSYPLEREKGLRPDSPYAAGLSLEASDSIYYD